MAATSRRRSARLGTYESNGRDYLAATIGWPRPKLDGWLTSPTVRPHLQLWHQLCVSGKRRFNEAIDWINTGENGYFYNPNDLEEDLLLSCLGEGSQGCAGEVSVYAQAGVKTAEWTTQELWARTAWRIVHANRGSGQAFDHTVGEHPSACYAFVIDVLCVAFHSIAFRGGESCYHRLINGNVTDSAGRDESVVELEEVLDDGRTESKSNMSSVGSSTKTSDNSADLDFVDECSQTSVSSQRSTPVRRVRYEGDEVSGARLVEEWIENSGQLQDMDSRGEPSLLDRVDEAMKPSITDRRDLSHNLMESDDMTGDAKVEESHGKRGCSLGMPLSTRIQEEDEESV